MSILGWIILGLISGFIASKIVNKQGEGCFLNVALGLVGAMVGGFIFTTIGGSSVNGFNLYSMFVAIIGAIVVLFLWHAATGNRTLR
ncbi:MAG TPA: GlsB/YeaQ/YmgE family stress response membrane protein [Rhizomicrobium sp.]